MFHFPIYLDKVFLKEAANKDESQTAKEADRKPVPQTLKHNDVFPETIAGRLFSKLPEVDISDELKSLKSEAEIKELDTLNKKWEAFTQEINKVLFGELNPDFSSSLFNRIKLLDSAVCSFLYAMYKSNINFYYLDKKLNTSGLKDGITLTRFLVHSNLHDLLEAVHEVAPKLFNKLGPFFANHANINKFTIPKKLIVESNQLALDHIERTNPASYQRKRVGKFFIENLLIYRSNNASDYASKKVLDAKSTPSEHKQSKVYSNMDTNLMFTSSNSSSTSSSSQASCSYSSSK